MASEPNAARMALCRDVWKLKQQGRTFADIASEYGWIKDGNLQRGKVERMVRTYRKWRVVDELRQQLDKTAAENDELKSKILTLNFVPPVINTYDLEQWRDQKSTLAHQKRYAVVAHMNDFHDGDGDTDAHGMTYTLTEHKQPDFIVVGSDFADFGVIGRFTIDPDEWDNVEDVLDEFRRYWFPHIDMLNKIAPKAVKVFIYGNHEIRLYDWIAENAAKFRNTITRAWVEAVQYGGRVLYLGRTQEVDIGNLLVQHGNVTSEHTSKGLLDRTSYQMSVMAGHIHKATSYTRQGRQYMVSAITAGCGQSLNPKYLLRKGLTPPRPWVQGTAFATVDMKTTYVDFENIVYQRVNGMMVANSSGRLFEREIVQVAA